MSTTHNRHPRAHDLSSVDPNALFALYLLLSERNVSRAASRLSVTQSAMSHKLRSLREALHDPLLVRGQGGMVLTDMAQALLPKLTVAFEMLTEGLKLSTGFDPAVDRRRFVVATSDYAEGLLLPRLGAILAKQAPNVSIETRPNPPASGLQAFLERGEADVAIVGPHVESDALRRLPIPAEGFAVIARAGHPRIKGPKITLRAFLKESHALVAPSGGQRGLVDEALERLGHTRHVAVVTRYFFLLPLLVARSDLIAAAPQRLAYETAPLLGLRVLPPPIELPRIPGHVVWHERAHKSPDHQWLRRVLVQGATDIDKEQRLNRGSSGRGGARK